ncbi:OadG family protein [Desulfobacula sp.]|uniref:OadG family protein n=1 Tax=Desulfobacula sp. TaxID=2593537 RepID=UPI00261AC202|nr:OadG family protein [Desulfobacula sp.]
MYGLEAINANNGWAISVVGVSIVFSGLVMLSLVISQLHKVLALWEDPSKIKALFKAKQSEDQSDKLQEKEIVDQAVFTESQKEVVRQFGLLIRTMEDHFSLPRLLHLAQISDLKNPHSNLNNLLETKIIIPDGSGFFTWEKETFDKAIL